MKKVISALMSMLSIICIQPCYADATANIHMQISGAAKDNAYFLCLPNVGCLSILAGDHGKTYPIYSTVDLSSMFVTNADRSLRVTAQSPSASCNTTVEPGHNVTISGQIVTVGNGNVKINNLHCSKT